MSDPNTPRHDDQREPAEQPAEGFSVTDEQHVAPSAPAAPGLGQPAQSFSAPAADPLPEAPGRPAFSSQGDPAPGQDWQHGQHEPEGSHLPGAGAGDQHLPSQPYGQQQAPGSQPGGAPYGQQPTGGRYSQPGSAPQYGSQPAYGALPDGVQPQYGAQPHGGQPQYGAPSQPQYSSGAPMSPVEEKNAGMWGHLSGLSTIVTGGWGGWIGPLIVYLIYKDRSAFAKQESKEALNFGIFMTILTIGLIVVGTLLSIVGIGFILLALWWVPGLLQVIFSIIGAMRVNNGGSYRYPFNWRLVK